MTTYYVLRKGGVDLFSGQWETVGEFDNYDDAYSDQMYRRDVGETVRLVDCK